MSASPRLAVARAPCWDDAVITSLQEARAATLIHNVDVFDGIDAIAADTVLLRDGQIGEVGTNLAAPPGTEVVDGHGGTLLPGLIDYLPWKFPRVAERGLRQSGSRLAASCRRPDPGRHRCCPSARCARAEPACRTHRCVAPGRAPRSRGIPDPHWRHWLASAISRERTFPMVLPEAPGCEDNDFAQVSSILADPSDGVKVSPTHVIRSNG